MEITKEDKIQKSYIDLSAYDKECLEKHLMTITVKGVEIPIWRFIETFLYVKDQNSNGVVRFKLRWAQKLLYLELLKQCLNGQPMRQNILKARQLGFSTLIAGIVFSTTMFTPNTRSCVLADIEDHASNIFEMYQTFYDHLDDSLENAEEIHEWELEHPNQIHPDSLKPELKTTRMGKVMVTKWGKSKLEVLVTSDTTGRSGSYTIVHSSETAFQKNLRKVNLSLFSCVSMLNPTSMIFIETTANGYNDYKQLWDRDAGGTTKFNALFVPWFNNPDYQLSVGEKGLPQIEEWIYKKWEEHPEVTQEQIMWYWAKYCEGFDEDGMKQEFPWDAKDSFISTGKSIFDMTKVIQRKEEVRNIAYLKGEFVCELKYSEDGQSIKVSDNRFRTTNSGFWKIFKQPLPKKHYLVMCDPTKGMNHDNTAIQVLDQNTLEQYAVFCGKVELEYVFKQIYCAACMYNNALVSVENNTGSIILDLLMKSSYKNMAVDQTPQYDDYGQGIKRRYGHNTNRRTRDPWIQQFVMGFNANPKIINDYDTLCEMETFQLVPVTSSGERAFKAMASGAKSTDDRVMAYAPAWDIRTQQHFDRREDDKKDDKFNINSPNAQDLWVRKLMREHSEREEKKRSVSNRLGFSWK